MKNGQKKFALLGVLIVVYLLFVAISKDGTFAWFTSEIIARGSVENATTEDLLSIKPGKVSYKKHCRIQLSIKVSNRSQNDIPIKLEHVKKKLSPDESVLAKMNQTVPCDSSEVTFHLTGMNRYINKDILVPLNKDSLKASDSLKENEEVKKTQK